MDFDDDDDVVAARRRAPDAFEFSVGATHLAHVRAISRQSRAWTRARARHLHRLARLLRGDRARRGPAPRDAPRFAAGV